MCHLLKMMTEREGSQNNTARDDEHDHEVVPVVESVHIHIWDIPYWIYSILSITWTT